MTWLPCCPGAATGYLVERRGDKCTREPKRVTSRQIDHSDSISTPAFSTASFLSALLWVINDLIRTYGLRCASSRGGAKFIAELLQRELLQIPFDNREQGENEKK